MGNFKYIIMENIKMCKGFDEFICYCCQRCDDSEIERLVSKLSIDPDNGRKYCNHHLLQHAV
jgi:hypothetical protein